MTAAPRSDLLLRFFDRRRTPVRALATALSVVLVWTPTARLWADTFADNDLLERSIGVASASFAHRLARSW